MERSANAVIVALILALVGVGIGQNASAREGLYIGAGGAQQSAAGDLDGKKLYADPSGNPIFVAGKLDTGNGIAATIGYGLNRFFAIEYLYANTQHNATSPVVGSDSDADLASQLVAMRITAPLGQRVEFFLRGGYGVYELNYAKYAKFGPASSDTGKVSYRGTGTGVGAGLEAFFNELGIGLGYTQHNATFTTAKPTGGGKLNLKPKLSAPITTTDLLFTWHFK